MCAHVRELTLLCHVRCSSSKGRQEVLPLSSTRRDCTKMIFKEVEWSRAVNSACVRARARVCVCVCVCVCVHLHVHVCMHVLWCVYACVYVLAPACLCDHLLIT